MGDNKDTVGGTKRVFVVVLSAGTVVFIDSEDAGLVEFEVVVADVDDTVVGQSLILQSSTLTD